MGYNILSLDGGGSWALIQARIVQDLYGDIGGHEILRKFDLVIANSGGSLVLAALCANMKPSEVIQVFTTESERSQVFSKLRFSEFNALGLFRYVSKKFPIGAKYNTRRKREGLIRILDTYDRQHRTGTQPFVDLFLRDLPAYIGKPSLQIVITGFDYFKERATFFRSNPRSLTDQFSGRFFDVTLVDAIHASSNAPVNYFQEYAAIRLENREPGPLKEVKTNWYWDGAVGGFNNPVLAGLIEAMTNELQRPLSDFKILSLGTGAKSKAIIVDHKYTNNPLLQDRYQKNQDKPFVEADDSTRYQLEVGKLAQSILSDPPDAASFMAYSILNRQLDGKANLVRINPYIAPHLDAASNQYVVPAAYQNDPGSFQKLLEMDMDAVKQEEINLIVELANRFLTGGPGGAIIPNQLIRGDADAPNALGFATYSSAKAKWMELEGGNNLPVA
jgi:uncharacterized protein